MTLIKPQKDPAIGHGKCDHRKIERVAGRHFGTSVMSDNKFKTAADTMEVMMAMLDWNDYRNQILARVGEIGKLSPDTVKGYMALGGAGAKTGHLDGKVRELIALAVAIALRCDGCIAVHTAAAKKHGATKEEIAEALGVGISVNAGAAMVYSPARSTHLMRQSETLAARTVVPRRPAIHGRRPSKPLLTLSATFKCPTCVKMRPGGEGSSWRKAAVHTQTASCD